MEGAHSAGSVNVNDFHVVESLNIGEGKLSGSCKFVAHEMGLEGMLEPEGRNANEAQLMVNQTGLEIDETNMMDTIRDEAVYLKKLTRRVQGRFRCMRL